MLGSIIDEKMKEREVGEVEALKGTIDNSPYHIFCMKEPDYNMKMMSTYGALAPD